MWHLPPEQVLKGQSTLPFKKKRSCNLLRVLLRVILSGSYTGCGNTWTVSESRTIDLDPTQSLVYKPWSVRNRPAMMWSTSQSELYSIFVIDTGNAINHGIFLNIPGNNINQSEVCCDIFKTFLHLKKLTFYFLRTFCSKFGWKWPSGSGIEAF